MSEKSTLPSPARETPWISPSAEASEPLSEEEEAGFSPEGPPAYCEKGSVPPLEKEVSLWKRTGGRDAAPSRGPSAEGAQAQKDRQRRRDRQGRNAFFIKTSFCEHKTLRILL